MSTDDQKFITAFHARGEQSTRTALHDLEVQILKTIDAIKAPPGVYKAKDIVEALSDRELATLELWAGKEHEVIHKEIRRRRDEYEAFTRRLAPRSKPELAE